MLINNLLCEALQVLWDSIYMVTLENWNKPTERISYIELSVYDKNCLFDNQM